METIQEQCGGYSMTDANHFNGKCSSIDPVAASDMPIQFHRLKERRALGKIPISIFFAAEYWSILVGTARGAWLLFCRSR